MRAIPLQWKQELKNTVDTELIGNKCIEYSAFIKKQKPSKYLYDFQNEIKDETTIARYAVKWFKTIDIAEYDVQDYLKLFKNLYKLTPMVKLRNFQYRLLLGKIFTNVTLTKWKIVENDTCNLCKNANMKQDIVHLLWDCEIVNKIWKQLTLALGKVESLTWTKQNIFYNLVHENPKHIVNLITLITKQWIFAHKCMDEIPNYHNLLYKILEVYKIELYDNYSHSARKWGPVLDLFSDEMLL